MFNYSGIDVESLICRVMWLSITHRAVSLVVLTTLSRTNFILARIKNDKLSADSSTTADNRIPND
jgi:hypothetical protein